MWDNDRYRRASGFFCAIGCLRRAVLISTVLATSMAMADPVVNGSEISWPDDGWYQVQSVDGSVTYCNGGQSCTVEPGVYKVINHSTGQRFDNVFVSGSASTPSDITVDGLRISWPDNGWYQVQTADGSASLCNGGSYCDVQPGTYLVINHTTGTRFTGIEVPGDEPGGDAPALINRDNHVELVAQVFAVYSGRIYEDTLPGIPEEFMSSHVSTEVEVSEDNLSEHTFANQYEYACDNGGVLEYVVAYGSYETTERSFNWENCLDDTILKNGVVVSSTFEYGGYHRNLLSSSYTADFSSGERLEIAGEYGSTADSMINPYIRRIDRWINSGFDYSLQHESATLAIREADTLLDYYWYDYDDDIFKALIQGSFQFNSPLTDNHDIDVATSETLYADLTLDGSFDYSEPSEYDESESTSYPEYPDWTFTAGELELSADDGSALLLSADSGDEKTAQITLTQDGVVLETFQQPWSLWWDVLTDVQEDPRD